MILMLGCPWDYSDPIAGLIGFPFLPRPRISADVRFSADVFSAPFWVSSFGSASVQLLSLRFCCLYVPPRSTQRRIPTVNIFTEGRGPTYLKTMMSRCVTTNK
ncbi:hypothetical protein V6N11_073300 [Hibiscus sabdariffa]|uniref:Uncharacterized protein n=1 Tax=Hibiscus sabdariffa TaxID=183260 RepID=A0ABR2N6I3_9ROSI